MGAVAACIRRNTNSTCTRTSTSVSASVSAGDQLSCAFPPLEGQAFCFLPLPVRTQLPLHINAYFELSSNRRDIWRGDDTTGESHIRGQWNDLLLQDVLAPLYGLLLSRAVLYTTQQSPHQQDTAVKMASQRESALLFTGTGFGTGTPDALSATRCEEYLKRLLEQRQKSLVILGLLPSPPPPEPWSLLSTALLPLLRGTEVGTYMKYTTVVS